MSTSEARIVCGRCRRPASACYCAHIPSLPTRTQVLLLQHPRERKTAIGTARMAHLALPGSLLRIGITFDDDLVVQRALRERRTYLLFPGEGAVAPETLPDEQITLVVVDGTWSQAQKLVKMNPQLGKLPRVGLSPSRPSEYQIRRQPAEFCVSTIEALAETLEVLERRPFQSLREPFRAMIATQQRYQREVHSSRHQKPRTRRLTRRQRLAAQIATLWPRLVVVQGDANGWARNDPAKQPSETVVWHSLRLDGERSSSVIAPRRTMAPATPAHTGVTEDALRNGLSLDAWRDRWRGFVRADDVLVHWGRFYTDLARADGLELPGETIDMRALMTEALRARQTEAASTAAALGASIESTFAGRAGARLDALLALLRLLRAEHLATQQ